ncbi:F-box protein SKIP23 [Setaria viridis]|uniref:F-box protein SKIP23 n=1 Tax=Setaria viridis TaxID=4556 RepID=UPI003B3B5471
MVVDQVRTVKRGGTNIVGQVLEHGSCHEFAIRLTVIDWLKFRAVCAAWNRAAETALASGRRPRPEPPWLMLAGSTADPTTFDFFSFHDGRSRTASLPEPAIQRRIWIGSAHGWVVTADEECALHLFNPVTGAQLPLPCITTMGFFQALPRTKSGKATGFLFHESSFLAVHWPDRAFKERLCSMTACGALLVWEPDGEKFKSRIAVPEHNEGEEYVYFRKYLAESLDGDLVLICREHRSCYGGESDRSASDDDYTETDPTVRFQVFVLREGCQRSEWKELHDLGGAALFIGYNSAVFFPADGIPNLLADYIYFTDDNLSISWRNKQEPRDMGVFDMKNKMVKLMPSVDQHSNNWPPPIWVTPSIVDIVKA